MCILFFLSKDSVFLSQVLLDMMNELQQECHIAGFSETTNNAIFQYALTGVKDKLVEDQLISNPICISEYV